ncbi:MAG: EAL domain-containing protein, partial [Betaproteobacteria bacterium]
MTRPDFQVKALKTSLRESEARYSSVIAAMAEGVVIISKHGRVVECNESAQVILDRSADEIIGRRGSAISRTAIKQTGKRFPLSECPVVSALRGIACSGVVMGIASLHGTRWISVNTRPIFDGASDGVTAVVASFNDITERKVAEEALRRSEERLYYLATHDVLTGLPNRSLLQARIDHAAALAERTNSLVAILFVDLDRFKQINDTLGHAAGDALLKAVATRLQECVRDADTVARQGGDEFVVVMENVQTMEEVQLAADRMQAMLAKPLTIAGQEVYITASMGVSLCPQDAQDGATLIRHADVAMYRAKQLGRSCVEFYDAQLDVHSREQLSLETRLRGAVDREEFQLHYQPRLNLHTGCICGVEALIRWKTAEGRIVAPGEFIPMAEDTGVIIQIGEWALGEACRQVRAWQDQGLPAVPVSVNLSAKQFMDDKLIDRVAAALWEAKLEPRWLELEITETAAMADLALSARILQTLHRMGLRVSLDDFGTGYSSLSYLRRFPIYALKIDRSFINNT